MNPLVEGLLQKATSQEAKIRDDARLQIAMLLEKHSPLANSPLFYEDLIPRDLLSLILTEVELNELLTCVCSLVMIRELPPGILSWGLRTDALSTVLDTLLHFVYAYGNELDEKTTREVLTGIDRCLAPVDQPLRASLSYLISSNNPTPFLETVSAYRSSNEEIALEVLNKVNEFLHETEDSSH